MVTSTLCTIRTILFFLLNIRLSECSDDLLKILFFIKLTMVGIFNGFLNIENLELHEFVFKLLICFNMFDYECPRSPYDLQDNNIKINQDLGTLYRDFMRFSIKIWFCVFIPYYVKPSRLPSNVSFYFDYLYNSLGNTFCQCEQFKTVNNII